MGKIADGILCQEQARFDTVEILRISGQSAGH
jgi:hypothetical protein